MKKLFTILISVMFCATLAISVFADTGKISGFIFDKSTSLPIPNANIFIQDTKLGAASQPGGYYFINNITPGNYDISVKIIGYKTVNKANVLISENTQLNFYAIPQPIQFDPVVVTASLSGHKQSQVTVSSEVLTPALLKRQGSSTAGEAVESVGGVYAKNYGGFAGVLSPSIRGTNPDQVVILLDGMRLNTAQGGGVDLNTIPVDALEKIEVVRGGHSAVVGSDAMGGAIQLITRESLKPEGFSYGLNSTMGSFGTKALNMFGAQKIGFLSYFVNYNRTQSEGNYLYQKPGTSETATRENNDYLSDNLFLKTKLNLNSKNNLQLIYQNLQSEKGSAGSVNINPWTGEQMLTPNARAKTSRSLASVQSSNQVSDRIRFEESVFFQTYELNYRDPDGWTPVDDLHKNRSYGFNLKSFAHINSFFNFVTGVEFRTDKLESTKFDTKNRNTRSAFAQAEFSHGFSLVGLKTKWIWIPALRWDSFSDVEAYTTPKIGVLVRAGEDRNMAFRANFGKAFRVPNFNDLYWPDEGWGKGNPDLAPETSINFDAGVIYTCNAANFLQLETSYFDNNINDLIAWGADDFGIFMPLNIGQARIKGIEAGMKLNIFQDITYLNIFHTWMKATDETENSAIKGNQLIYRPENKLDVIGGLKLGEFSINLNYRAVSKRFITSDNSMTLPKYQLLNGNIGYGINFSGFKVNAKLQIFNILDKSICLYDGYPMPGREVRFSFGIDY